MTIIILLVNFNVIPKTIDTIRALTEAESDPKKSIYRTNRSLGIRQRFV